MTGSMRSSIVSLVAAGALLMPAHAAHATQQVNACGVTCTTDCELGKDLVCCPTSVSGCDGIGGITLTNGADLDLRGHSLTCNGDDPVNRFSTCYAPAVTMTSTTSIVKNGVSNVSQIKGFWLTGVDCQGKTGSRVTGIQFLDVQLRDVISCAQVDHNVFLGATKPYNGHIAINSSGVADSDEYYDNYIFEYETGVLVTGAKGVEVDHNVVVMPDSGGDPNANVGIDVSGMTATNLDVDSNILMGATTNLPIAGTTSLTRFVKNVCDRNNPQCADCATDGWCAAVSPPFAGF